MSIQVARWLATTQSDLNSSKSDLKMKFAGVCLPDIALGLQILEKKGKYC